MKLQSSSASATKCFGVIALVTSLTTSCFALLFSYGLSAQAAPTKPPAAPTAPAAAPTAPPETPPAPPAPPAEPVYKDGIVKMGSELKRTIGRVTDVEKGDNGCYLTLVDEKKFEFIEIGLMEFCTKKPSLKGQKVELSYRMETIQASSCYGDPKCKKTETLPLVVKVAPMN